eukprot:TRINITY_DN28054_c0_g1_i1.p2 TRINITY_DN28054_c0_g1~~TRINITY_DN28054_c0_g1_i1.p2  ORF type:complete len:452 (+),score=93.83 TRINITY_DN28054_c0_g1_i1:50-1405(+)
MRAVMKGALAMGAMAMAALALPLPTVDQLAWHKHEIAALIHFNMATFVADGDPACNRNNWNTGINCSNPATFNPAQLDIGNWVESLNALGARHAILTAKHGCGFLLWDTKTKLPDGSPYGYAVRRNGGFARDVLAEFSQTLEQAGIGHGFYYSTGNNFYLNTVNFQPAGAPLPGQAKVTMDQYYALVIDQVTELWTAFGNLTEIWFDHGYGDQLRDRIIALLKANQPHAVGFNGFGVMPSPVRWVGTESGLPNYPIWSTGTDGQGDPSSQDWVPAGCDTTLQDGDHWFYVPGMTIRSLATLIDVYHHTVGQNGLLELDFAIDRTGRVDPQHAARYKEFGDWIRACYGKPVATTSGTGTSFTLTIPKGSQVDRVIIQEDQSQGQRIRSYEVDVQLPGSSAWQSVATGSSVGNKRIQLFATPVTPALVRLTIPQSAATPVVSAFSAFSPCPSA